MAAARSVLASVALCPRVEEGPQTLVDACVEHVPGCTGAAVVLLSSKAEVVAQHAATVGDLVVSEGPVADCVATGEVVVSTAPAIVAVPVRCSRNRTAVLVLLGPVAGAVADGDLPDVHVIAHCAATQLCAADELTALRGALRNRELVGQAVGLLVERRRLTPKQAYELLSRASQNTNRKVRDLAADMLETGIDLTEPTDRAEALPSL